MRFAATRQTAQARESQQRLGGYPRLLTTTAASPTASVASASKSSLALLSLTQQHAKVNSIRQARGSHSDGRLACDFPSPLVRTGCLIQTGEQVVMGSWTHDKYPEHFPRQDCFFSPDHPHQFSITLTQPFYSLVSYRLSAISSYLLNPNIHHHVQPGLLLRHPPQQRGHR